MGSGTIITGSVGFTFGERLLQKVQMITYVP